MLIRDELDIRILVALAAGPLHAYAIIKRIETDGALLTPAEERSMYRKLPRLLKVGYIDHTVQAGTLIYHLEAKTHALLKAHQIRTEKLVQIISSRIDYH